MKALPWITLAICVSFLVFQQASISSTTRSQRALEERIAKAESSPLGAARRNEQAAPATRSKGGGPRGATGTDLDLPRSLAEIDLQELMEAMRRAEGREIPSLKVMMRLQSLILEAEPDELVDLIQRAEALENVPDDMKRDLIGELVGGLAEQDPRRALEVAFASEVLDIGRNRWRFSGAFSKWVKDDPTAAIAWYDQQVASGAFESRTLDGAQDGRIQFESAAVRSLLESNPAQAQARLLALPEDQRLALFNNGLHPSRENAAAHADLIRTTIPADAQAAVLASSARNMLEHRDYGALAAYTEEIGASAAERSAIVAETVMRKFERHGWENKPPTAEEMAEMQQFLEAQVPEQADRLTGASLARFGRKNQNFEEAYEMIDSLHRSNPNDDLLVGFLQESHARGQHRDAARELATRITDPARRNEVLQRLDDPR